MKPFGLFSNIIRDPVHGNISFSERERKVIDTPLFQRLRDISQLGFLKFVFPGARHSRFEHSIGVMHLAGRIFGSMKKNQMKILTSGRNLPDEILATENFTAIFESHEILIRLRLAALLHDLGHGPFSHVSEFLLKSVSYDDIKGICDFPAPYFHRAIDKKKQNGKPVTHETISVLMISRLMEKVFPDEPGLCADVCAIIDPDMPLAPETVLTPPGSRSILHDIISHEIDADRMDYLLRDSKSCGVNYGLFDLERLLANLYFTVPGGSGRPSLAVTDSGLHPLEHFLFGRYQMYMQVYTHKTNTAFEAMFKKLGESLNFPYPLEYEPFINFHDHSLREMIWKQNSSHSELSALLIRDLFSFRRPWKLIYEKASYLGDDKQKEQFNKLYADLTAEFGKNSVLAFKTDKGLTGYTPGPDRENTRMVKVIRYDHLERCYRLKDLNDESYLISAFEKRFRRYRLYANPDLKETIIKNFIKGP